MFGLGQFVLDHHTRPNVESRVVPPSDLPITFQLSLVWSQQTFDSPSQIWRATSDYSLKVGVFTRSDFTCCVQLFLAQTEALEGCNYIFVYNKLKL